MTIKLFSLFQRASSLIIITLFFDKKIIRTMTLIHLELRDQFNREDLENRYSARGSRHLGPGFEKKLFFNKILIFSFDKLSAPQ
jgi:hypothetical protein